MKSASTQLATHIASETTTLATCWKVTRKDGLVLGFTDHDQDLTVDGLLYQASTGYTRSAIHGIADLSVDNLDIQSALNSETSTPEGMGETQIIVSIGPGGISVATASGAIASNQQLPANPPGADTANSLYPLFRLTPSFGRNSMPACSKACLIAARETLSGVLSSFSKL